MRLSCTLFEAVLLSFTPNMHIFKKPKDRRESPDSDGKVWRGYTTKVKPTLAVSYPKLLDFPERLSSQVML